MLSPEPARDFVQPEWPEPPAKQQVRQFGELEYHVHNAPIAVIEWDGQLRVTRWTGRAEELFGWTAEEVHGKHYLEWSFVHESDRDAIRQRLTGEQGPRCVLVIRNHTKAGEVLWCQWHNSFLLNDLGEITSVLSLVLDVSDRKCAEREREALDRQLLDTQKWESLGVLAGGVAHGFNNILTVILGGAGLAQRVLPVNSPAVPYLLQIEQACRRAAELCRQMVAYAGRGQVSTSRTDLNALVRESERLLEVSASAQTRIRFDLADGMPGIMVDAAHARQVLLNLVMNATEATAESGGEVVVRTQSREVPAGGSDPRSYLQAVPGCYVELSVSDNGPGIADHVKARMFDPFFTTKFTGRGLGLAAVLGIVRAHRGAISVDTAIGRGTTVRILWPVAPAAVPGVPAPRPIEPIVSATVTISSGKLGAALVVDDEVYVREITASTLEEMGYEPLLAGDGLAGLEVYRQHGDTIRVAVIDLTMPGMTGDRLLRELRRINSGLPAVLVSGYTDRQIVESNAITAFLLKPFRHEELAAVVRHVLRGVGSGWEGHTEGGTID